MQRIKNANEAMTGVFLILVSLLALTLAWPLGSNTEVGLGPGYVPKMFAIVQALLGALMIGHSFVQSGEPMAAWHLRPLVLILGSVAFFAVSIERLGLGVAVVGLVLISCLAKPGTRWREAMVLAVGSALFSGLVFVKLLGLSILLWPPVPWGH